MTRRQQLVREFWCQSNQTWKQVFLGKARSTEWPWGPVWPKWYAVLLRKNLVEADGWAKLSGLPSTCMTKDYLYSLYSVIQHVLPKPWLSKLSHMKMILGFPEMQEATTTEDTYSGHLNSLMEEWVTLRGWQQLCKRYPSHWGNWRKWKGTYTQAATNTNFSLSMLHVGWIWSSEEFA